MSRRAGFESEMKKRAALVLRTATGCRYRRELENAGGFGILGIVLRDENLFREADLREEPDAVVVDVDLVPFEAVACADGVGVVVVVPAFAAGEQSDPPVIAGVVLGLEAALAPEMRCGVDQPGGVKAEGDAKEGSPENHANGTGDGVAGARAAPRPS